MGSVNRIFIERKDSPTTKNLKELDKRANSLTFRAMELSKNSQELETFVENRLVVNSNITSTESDQHTIVENDTATRTKAVKSTRKYPKEVVEYALQLLENMNHEIVEKDNSVIVGETHADDVSLLPDTEKITPNRVINFQNSPKNIPTTEYASACAFANFLDKITAENLAVGSKTDKNI